MKWSLRVHGHRPYAAGTMLVLSASRRCSPQSIPAKVHPSVKDISSLADLNVVNIVPSTTQDRGQPRQSARPSRRRIDTIGFTLVELLIIVSILGILAALAVPMMATSSDQARTEAVASNVSHIRAMIAYH